MSPMKVPTATAVRNLECSIMVLEIRFGVSVVVGIMYPEWVQLDFVSVHNIDTNIYYVRDATRLAYHTSLMVE